MRRFCLLAIVVFFMAGCASVEIAKITPEKPYNEGIRFYRPHPYLWVTRDKDDVNVLQSTIIWLPNKKEEYVIRVKGGIGTVALTGTLENGWNLTEFGDTRDSKTPEMITALTGFFPSSTKLAKAPLVPGLYKFIFDDKTGLIKDLKAIIRFE